MRKEQLPSELTAEGEVQHQTCNCLDTDRYSVCRLSIDMCVLLVCSYPADWPAGAVHSAGDLCPRCGPGHPAGDSGHVNTVTRSFKSSLMSVAIHLEISNSF